ncbi:hypothetical protein AAMO2058_000706000 [Amorphochlora amoebiformis]
MFQSSHGAHAPLLNGHSSLRDQNDKLNAQITSLGQRIIRLQRENKELRAVNKDLRERLGDKECKKVKTSEQSFAESRIYTGGYQASSEHTREASKIDHNAPMCYSCCSKAVTSKCAATDCERDLCSLHSYKMLTNSEIFCDECYSLWSNAIPAELSLLAKKVYSSLA